MSKQKLSNWNRWLAWITVPVVIAAILTRYVWDMRGTTIYLTIQTLVGIMPLIHFGISLFIFGIPRGSGGAKVTHIYIGYVVFLAIMISQSVIGMEPIYTILTWVMYLVIFVHVILGTQHWRARNKSKEDPMSELHRGSKP